MSLQTMRRYHRLAAGLETVSVDEPDDEVVAIRIPRFAPFVLLAVAGAQESKGIRRQEGAAVEDALKKMGFKIGEHVREDARSQKYRIGAYRNTANQSTYIVTVHYWPISVTPRETLAEIAFDVFKHSEEFEDMATSISDEEMLAMVKRDVESAAADVVKLRKALKQKET